MSTNKSNNCFIINNIIVNETTKNERKSLPASTTNIYNDKVKRPIFGATFGIVCSLISVLCFSFNSVIVKLLNSSFNIPGIQVLVGRSLIQFLICAIILLIKRHPPCHYDGRTNFFLFGRAITGTLSMCCLFTAFNKVPIGDATTIYFSSPVFVAVFAYIFLNESFSILQSCTCLITIIGVGFISKPAFIFGPETYDQHYSHQTFGQILSIIAAITSSMTMIFIRKLRTISPVVVVFWFSFAIMNCGTIALVYFGTYRPLDWSEPMCIGPLILIGVMSMVEQYFFTLALQHEDASTISVTRSFNIVLAFLWEVIIFQETITWTSIIGAILVSSCIIVLALFKSCSIKSSSSPPLSSLTTCPATSSTIIMKSPPPPSSSSSSSLPDHHSFRANLEQKI